MRGKERVPPPVESNMTLQLACMYQDSHPVIKKGSFIITVTDEYGNVTDHREVQNLITYDAGILGAYQLINASPARTITMLAIGTGATGPSNNPDAADMIQRSLNNEIFRKAFSSVTFVDSTGAVSAVPTHVVDYTVTFGVGEAVGALNEMSLISPLDPDPGVTNHNPDVFPAYDETRDIALYDVNVNYATFPVVNKPVNSTLVLTWRLTY